MHLFLKKNKNRLLKAEIFEQVPSPSAGQILVIPIDNELWHPNIAVYLNNRKTPDWYKNILAGDFGLRSCYGLGDYMRMGYTIPLWANLEVRPPVSKLESNWSARYTTMRTTSTANNLIHENPPEFMSKHDIFSQEVVQGQQFSNGQTGECPVKHMKGKPDSDYLKLTNPWLFKTAPGWSCLFIQPQWEPNKDYDILAGVVNTDSYHHCNIVFNIKSTNGFSVEAGTPLLHIIPFKRSQIIKKSLLLKGDEGMYKILNNLGFDSVFRDNNWEGRYKREQHRIDKSLE